MTDEQQQQSVQDSGQVVSDRLESTVGKLGDQTRDKAASTYFARKHIDDEQLVAAYQYNWIARKIVDIPAKDALRKWRTHNHAEHERIEAEERRLNVAAKVTDGFIKGRLFGGAAVYIGTDQDPAEPMNLNAIRAGGVKYLTVMTRRELLAGEIELDPMSEYYGLPKYYEISSTAQAQVRIHPSRLVVFTGDKKADPINDSSGNTYGWHGESVIQSTYDAISNAQSSFSLVASLLFEANVDVIKIPNLMANIGRDGYESNILKRFSLASANKGINGSLIIDGDEDYLRKPASFTQLSDLMETFALHASASADIPATRFLAQSPSGLVATGEFDMKNYHDKLQSMQEIDIGPAMWNLDAALLRSAGLSGDPDYDWRPFTQMSEEEIAAIGKSTTEMLKTLFDMNIFGPDELRSMAIDKMETTGVMPNIQSVLENLDTVGEVPELDDPEMPVVEEPEGGDE